MARTFIRQDTQIRRSDVYTDTTSPTEAAYETNPVNIEEDLNNLRSQMQNFLNRNGASMPAGNWWDNIAQPSTFENGARRGISTLNQELHDLERKRVLVENYVLTDVTVPASASAVGTLTLNSNVSAGDTVMTGTKTYTFTSPLGAADGDVLVGGSASDSLDNLISAINNAPGGAGSGSLWAAATTANGFVSAAAGALDTMVVTALVAGTGGNSIATTEVLTDPLSVWGGALLSGGAGDVVVLAALELPSVTTAAVGSVTTLGTVAAYNASFPNRSLAEVGGTTSIDPKNLSIIVSGDARDPIISAGRVVYGLFQTEIVTDAHVMNGTTQRAMLSFVRINAAGDDLEFVPAADIAGLEVNYSTKTRKPLEGLEEQDFLKGAVIDVGAGTTNRQNVYNSQGTTPVDVTTHSYLDLEGAGLVWQIRDDAQAPLFEIIEGSGAGTSQINVRSDVDEFDVDAVVNDFSAGVTVRSGGTRPIAVGVTDGVIESTSGDLRVNGTGELYLDDGNQTGSTWAQVAGVKLSETTSEWDAYEAKFGGEVSLFNAIVQAANMGARKAKVYANVTVTTTADNDVGGVSGGTNLSAQLPNMSTGSFLTDYDVFLNGNLLRPGADDLANNDYYPGTSLANGQLKFEFTVKAGTNPDVICVVPYNPP